MMLFKKLTKTPADQGLQCRLRCTCRQLKYIFLALVVIVVYYMYQNYNDKVVMYFSHDAYDSMCVVPELDPFDRGMMEFVHRLPPLVCDHPPAVVYVDHDNIIQYNKTAMKQLSEDETTVQCTYSFIHRTDKRDMIVEFSDPIPLTPPADIPADFFLMICKGKGGKSLFHNTMTKIHKTKRPLKEKGDEHYNLLLFGLDSLSRSSSLRQLPKTYKYLTKELQGTDFKGYMKVGDNTFPNIVSLLTGVHAWTDELPKFDYIADNFDNFPLIWKNFSAEGYATMYAEDLPNLSTFNGDKAGFLELPTDHYMRPFWLANFKLTPMHNLVTHVGRVLENLEMKISKGSAMCVADKKDHVVITDYLKQFMRTYRNNRKFMLSFLTELSHEFQNFLNYGDEDFYEFFKWMEEEGFMENTIIVMFGDHGIKFGSTQHLFIARLENRMPLGLVVLPKSLKKKYPNIVKSFKVNEKRLASTFDLHATIRDILQRNFKNPTEYYVKGKRRGVSLFKPLPEQRSCKDADIAENFCACYKSEAVNVTGNTMVRTIADGVTSHINTLLSGTPECAKLTLSSVMEARKVASGLNKVDVYSRKNLWFKMRRTDYEQKDDARYTVVFKTVPGEAEFHATCAFSPSTGIHVYGNVDRINKYGNQSSCINEPRLKPLCFCQ